MCGTHLSSYEYLFIPVPAWVPATLPACLPACLLHCLPFVMLYSTGTSTVSRAGYLPACCLELSPTQVFFHNHFLFLLLHKVHAIKSFTILSLEVSILKYFFHSFKSSTMETFDDKQWVSV